jgi:spore coat protein CotH
LSLELRRHWKLWVLLALVLAVLTLGLGHYRITAYTVPGSLQVMDQGIDHDNDVALFDDSVVHSIHILISDADYEQMITTYQQTGEKEYFHADVVIDGVRVSNVGVRLKGNASLQTALGRGFGGRGFDRQQAPGGERQRPEFDPENMPEMRGFPSFDPEDMPAMPDGRQFDPENMPQRPDWAQPPSDGENLQPPDVGPAGDMPAMQGDASAKLPLMIKFNEFVSGQTYQGYKNLAIRTYGISSDAAMLHEPVTNSVFRLAGLPATQTAYVGLQLNDGAEQLYSISEVINDDYLEQHFDNPDGVLYKAEVGSTLTYAGEDPSLYATNFTQQTRVNDADMAPLIAFMRFLSESDDATFERELPDWLDVDAFATYLAINNLLVNTDSIIGMNNNYYLYYDDVSQRFTLLMWDANESLGKHAGASGAAQYDIYDVSQQGGRGRGGGTNTLVSRFMASPTFKALYEAKLQQVYQQAFASGAMTALVEQYADLVRQANRGRDLVVLEDYERAVAKVLDFIEQRSDYLAHTSLLGDLASPSE